MIWKDWETGNTGLPTFMNTASYTLDLFYIEINKGHGFKSRDMQHDFRKGLCSCLSRAPSPGPTVNISLYGTATLSLPSTRISFFSNAGALVSLLTCLVWAAWDTCNHFIYITKQYKIFILFVQFEAKNLTACVKIKFEWLPLVHNKNHHFNCTWSFIKTHFVWKVQGGWLLGLARILM